MSRTPEEFLRIYGPPEYREWVDAQRCLVTTCETRENMWRPDGRGFREICHVRNGGMGRKADWNWTVVLCWRCHEASGKRRTFEYIHAGKLRVGEVAVETLMDAAVATHEAFRHSEPGRRWLARMEEVGVDV